MIKLYGYSKKNVHEIKYNSFTFPGGEIQVRLDMDVLYPKFHTIRFDAQLDKAADIIELLLVNDAVLEAFGNIDSDDDASTVLKLGYLPYARQDRTCASGEAHSSLVMSCLINSCEFDKVVVLDPHSEASVEDLQSLTIRTQSEILGQQKELVKLIKLGAITMVAPDAGSTGKVEALAKEFDVEFIQASKQRDPINGQLSGFSYEGCVEGEHLLIVDDICDGGGTFIGLAEELRAGGATTVDLYVSHSIFSRGTDHLWDNGIDHIYTTDSFNHGRKSSPLLTVIPWS